LDSKVATIGYGNNVKTSYTYDSRDRPKSIYSFSGTTQLMGLNYTYDGVGNVLSINTESFTYNSLNELISSSGPWGSTSYFYDGAANMLNMTQGSTTTTYGYDSYNRMTSAGSATLTYDANGNLKKIVNGTTTWLYYYDYNNRLIGVSKNGVTVQNNTYSGDGSRVEQTLGSSSSIVYTYEGGANNILFEKNLTSSIVTKNYYANGLLLGEVVGSSTTYYLLDDALGSIRDVTTASNPVNTVFSSDYKPYGLNYGLSESLSIFNFEYTHKPYDSSTGLYYYGARYYYPSISRFITEDSAKYLTILNPLSLNRYGYAENNPETLIDPTGNMIGFPSHYGGYPSTSSSTTPPAPTPTTASTVPGNYVDPGIATSSSTSTTTTTTTTSTTTTSTTQITPPQSTDPGNSRSIEWQSPYIATTLTNNAWAKAEANIGSGTVSVTWKFPEYTTYRGILSGFQLAFVRLRTIIISITVNGVVDGAWAHQLMGDPLLGARPKPTDTVNLQLHFSLPHVLTDFDNPIPFSLDSDDYVQVWVSATYGDLLPVDQHTIEFGFYM
jgi:RHS repeat-associated protein